MKSLLVTLFVLVSIASTQAQVQYQRYGTPGYDAFQAMTTTPDGSIWVAGTRDKFGWVVSLDEEGKILREIQIRPNAPESELDILGIDPGENGNLILTGAAKVGTNSSSWYGWLAVLDAQGKIIHRRVLDLETHTFKAKQNGNSIYVAGLYNEFFKRERRMYKLTLNTPQVNWRSDFRGSIDDVFGVGSIDIKGEGCTVTWVQDSDKYQIYTQETFDKNGNVTQDFIHFESASSPSSRNEFYYSGFDINLPATYKDSDQTTWVAFLNWSSRQVTLLHFDVNGRVLSKGEYPYNGNLVVLSHLRVLENGQKILVGATGSLSNSKEIQHLYVLTIDEKGLVQSQRELNTGNESCRIYGGFLSKSKGYIFLGAIKGDPKTYYCDGLIMYPQPTDTYTFGGKLFADLNADCVQNPNENGLEGWMVRLKYPNGKWLDETMTNANGEFSFKRWPGNYLVEVVNKQSARFQPCSKQTVINVGVQGASTPIAIGIQERNWNCRNLPVVSMPQPVIVPCSSTYFYVQLENVHSQMSFPNQLSVDLDQRYNFLSASHGVSPNGNTLLFEVPSLMPKEKMTVSIQVNTPCAVPYGKILPVHARLVQQPCADQWTDALWSVQGKCESGKVVFEVQDERGIGNTSGLNFEVLRNYFTIERQPRIDLQQNSFQWSIPADGNTYEFRLKGLTVGPWGDSVLTATVTGCTAHADQLVQDQFAYTQPLPYYQKGVFSIYPVTVYKEEATFLPASPGYGWQHYFSKVQQYDHTLYIPGSFFSKASNLIVDLQFDGPLEIGTFQPLSANVKATWKYIGLNTIRLYLETQSIPQSDAPVQYRFSIHPTKSIIDTFEIRSQIISIKGNITQTGGFPKFLDYRDYTFSPERWMEDPFDPQAISIGGNGSDYLSNVLHMPDGEVYLVSYSNTYDLKDNLSVLLHLIDAKKTKVRTTVILEKVDGYLQFMGLVPLENGEILLVVNRYSQVTIERSEYKLVLIKVDQSGQLISETVVDAPMGYDFITALAVPKSASGEQLLLANHKKVSGTTVSNDQMLWEIKSDGNLVEWKTQSFEVQHSVSLNIKKKYTIARKSIPVTSTGKRNLLVLYNDRNEILWSFEVENFFRKLQGYSFDEDGTVFLFWSEWNKGDPSLGTMIFYLEKINLKGEVEAVVNLPELSLLNAFVKGFVKVGDQGFMFYGSYYPPNENHSQLFMCATDVNGTIKKLELFGSKANEEVIQISLLEDRKVKLYGETYSGYVDNQIVIYETTLPAILTATGGQEHMTQPSITVHPNPAADWLSIVMPEPLVLPQRWELLHTNGVLVQEGVLMDQCQRISIQKVPAGVYLLRMPGTAWATTRVVVQR